ncbi:hypothetical protein K438DRAFT_1753345 [Mycena galopus ATCC 62051]|nr:hypothetical protein K438DRAFT_1753345 [Mycena galopus ATCC 62051]
MILACAWTSEELCSVESRGIASSALQRNDLGKNSAEGPGPSGSRRPAAHVPCRNVVGFPLRVYGSPMFRGPGRVPRTVSMAMIHYWSVQSERELPTGMVQDQNGNADVTGNGIEDLHLLWDTTKYSYICEQYLSTITVRRKEENLHFAVGPNKWRISYADRNFPKMSQRHAIMPNLSPLLGPRGPAPNFFLASRHHPHRSSPYFFGSMAAAGICQRDTKDTGKLARVSPHKWRLDPVSLGLSSRKHRQNPPTFSPGTGAAHSVGTSITAFKHGDRDIVLCITACTSCEFCCTGPCPTAEGLLSTLFGGFISTLISVPQSPHQFRFVPVLPCARVIIASAGHSQGDLTGLEKCLQDK